MTGPPSAPGSGERPGPDARTTSELAIRLTQAAGIPAGREVAVSRALAELLALAASLDELALEGISPAFAPPRWP
jgi:hypothetical protein